MKAKKGICSAFTAMADGGGEKQNQRRR